MNTPSFLSSLQDDIVKWATPNPTVRAIILGGSKARSIRPGDKYSDLDILLFVTDPDNEAYIEWARSYAPTWMVVREINAPTRLWLVVYVGGQHIHLSVNGQRDLQEIIDTKKLWSDMMRGYRILHDKDNLGPQLPVAVAHPPPVQPSAEEFAQCIDKYFYGTIYIATQLKRGNLWTVKWVDQVEQKFLLEMIVWHARVQDKEVDTWHRGEFMKEWVREDIWQSLHDVFSHFDANDSWRALFASIGLFKRLAQETAQKMEFAYPEQMINEVVSHIKDMQQDHE